MIYVFRNNTVERFFKGDYQFSGYDDISVIPSADSYIWWYQVPFKYDITRLVSEVSSFAQKLQFVASRIGDRQLVVLTIEKLYYAGCKQSERGLDDAMADFNRTARELSEANPSVKVVDFSGFSRKYSSYELVDWKFFFMYQMPMNPRLSLAFDEWFNFQINSINHKRKKCLVLDLDNTLWGGVLGEDGIEGIQVDGEYPGKVYHYWQEGILELKRSGIILAICSKNNEQDVEDLWRSEKNMVLREEDFACKRINWKDKASNIREIAAELNVGLDSFVFVDDNPSERDLVRKELPMVEVPEWPAQIYGLPFFYEELVNKYFLIYHLTEEDNTKTEQYRQNTMRAVSQSQFTNIEDFVRSLDIHLKISRATDITIPRIAQMTQKTNQFNLTTKRYSESDIRNMINNGATVYSLSVRDKFGDSGVTGCMILCQFKDYLKIDTLLLSCRILGKGIEYSFVKHVLSKLISDTALEAEYIATAKNLQVSSFYDVIGMNLIEESHEVKRYRSKINELDLRVADYYHID